MLIESVFDSSECLSHVLFVTFGTREAIDQVATTTTDVLHAGVVLFRLVADNDSRFVKHFAVIADWVVAKTEASVFGFSSWVCFSQGLGADSRGGDSSVCTCHKLV